MEVVYAAPFVALSIIAFACFLVIPPWRPYAFHALVVPVAFGFCSIVGMTLATALFLALHLRFVNTPVVGLVGIADYFFSGLIGSLIAVQSVQRIETRLKTTEPKRPFATRVVISISIFLRDFHYLYRH